MLRPDVYEPGWSPVTLPESRGLAPYRADDAASPRWQMDWYHVRYVLPPRGASPPLAVYVPRVQGGPAEVYVNGRLLASNRDDWSTQWNRPLFVPVPHDVVFTNPATDVEVDVVVGLPWHAGLSHAMSRITVGPAHEIRPAYDRRMMLQVTAPQVTSLTILVLGLFSFGFWWRQRHESAYLLFALTSVVWWFRNLHYHVQLPDPGPASRLVLVGHACIAVVADGAELPVRVPLPPAALSGRRVGPGGLHRGLRAGDPARCCPGTG